MSSADGPSHILSQWMPSSTRAGVILSPVLEELAGSMRNTSAMGSLSPGPDDSFASDFAPLPASADSSCLGLEAFPRATATDRPLNGLSSVPARRADGEMDSLDEMTRKTQDLPLLMKLEQLRKWQQQMQEQLKAHQLEELLRLQEEQQRLLGMIDGAQDCTADDAENSGLSGSKRGLNRQERLPTGQHYDEEEDKWNPREDAEELSVETGHFHETDDTLEPSSCAGFTEDKSETEDTVLQDRPIKSGIVGQMKTFEELLEEQLRLEEQRLKSARQQQQGQDGAEDVQAAPKRAFLKRGEGLSRFSNVRKASLPNLGAQKDPKPQPQARVIPRSNSEPASFQKGGGNGVQRAPVQRKTATLNKENRLRGLGSPPREVRAESKAARTKVLGSHQRQNTKGPETIHCEPEGRLNKQHQRQQQAKEQSKRTVGPSAQTAGHNTQPNPVTKHVGTVRVEHEAAKERSGGSGVNSAAGTSPVEGGAVLQESFELSFQEKLQRWECDLQVENIELGEFELLEEAAEELSFSSNSSFVMKVLQMDRLRTVRGPQPRRLSSTPIKSPPRGALRRSNSAGAAMVSGAPAVNTRDDKLQSKVRIDSKKEPEGIVRENQQESPGLSSCSGSETEDQGPAFNPALFPGTVRFPTQPNPPYDKRSYEDEDSSRGSASDVSRDDSEESDSQSVSNADESTLIEDGEGEGEGEGPLHRVLFDDNDTWNDTDDAPGDSANRGAGDCPANRVSPTERVLPRKVAASRVAEPDRDRDTVVGSDLPPLPPASQLMTKLFPSLKPKAQNAPLPVPPAPLAAVSVAVESKMPEGETSQQVQSRQLRERLVELEIEIERFKKENAALAKLRQDNEKSQENLRKERLEFERTKAEELAKFEEHKRAEGRKLQKERKLFEKHASAARAIPDKKEREEIQMLKQQLGSLQEELKGRESRWSSTHSRLRQQIDSLNQENTSLRDEIRMLEKLRISSWKKSPDNAEKDTETKEAPKISENSVSSVPKGVKFATPLASRGSGCSVSPPQSAFAARRNSSQVGAGMKSSLRRPSAPGAFSAFSPSSHSSSPFLTANDAEERPASASKSQEKPPNQQGSSCAPKPDPLPIEPECSESEESESAKEVITHPDGKIEKVLAGGDRLISFPNGTKKEVSADGQTVTVTFFNGDTKQISADQRVTYFYADAQTTHITYPDGVEVLHFPNNQTEKHFPDGRKEITFPDQTVKNLFPNGREESVLTDGTIIQVNPDGTKEIHFNTGQREIHTADYKRREYPDGTVKTVYADGRQETRYPTGRVRIKDKDGNVVLDNRA